MLAGRMHFAGGSVSSRSRAARTLWNRLTAPWTRRSWELEAASSIAIIDTLGRPTSWVSVGDWPGGIPAVLAALDGGQCTTVWDGNEPTVLCCENPNFVIDGSGNCACPDGGTDPSCDGGDSDPPPPPPPPDPPGGGGDGGSGGDGGHGIDCGDERTDIIAEYLQFGAPNPPSCGDFATGGSSLFFSWSEMNGGFSTGNPHQPWGVIRSVLWNGLDATRLAYGSPVIVNSGYRCPHGNASVGGASSSKHMEGIAADIRPVAAQISPSELALLRHLAETDGGATFAEVYSSHVHVDWR